RCPRRARSRVAGSVPRTMVGSASTERTVRPAAWSRKNRRYTSTSGSSGTRTSVPHPGNGNGQRAPAMRHEGALAGDNGSHGRSDVRGGRGGHRCGGGGVHPADGGVRRPDRPGRRRVAPPVRTTPPVEGVPAGRGRGGELRAPARGLVRGERRRLPGC